jgi:membrane-associated phospholipid phosphatase
MFETDPNLWLQSFASPWLTWLLYAVTTAGYDWFYVTVILVAGFALRLRPMLGVMLALLLAGLCTHVAKETFRLPRPMQVDARVLYYGEANDRWLVADGGAPSFASLPSPEAILAERAVPDPDFGFISGHVASATALCASLWLFFGVRSRRWRLALLAWPVLMALSRMYLGKHFLADAIGGAATGVLAACAARWLWDPRPARVRALAALAIVLAGAAFAWSPLHPSTVSQLLGLAATAALLAWRGFPDDRAPWVARLARVGLAFALYAITHLSLDGMFGWAGWTEADPATIPLATLGTVLVLYGTVFFSRAMGLYRNAGPRAAAEAAA